jgi:hypothetical protein
MHSKSVARLGRSAVADAVGEDDVEAGGVERLARPPVPCRIITALSIAPLESRCGVPSVA